MISFPKRDNGCLGPDLESEEFKKLGGQYEKGADWQSFVLVDGLLVTGQNPGSSSEVAKALPRWDGKTVVDATNAFGTPPEALDGLPSSAFVAKAFTGAKLVKGFNHLIAAVLATDPVVQGGHRVVFLSSDDDDAIAPVAALAKQLGFAPVQLGKLGEGGALVHARGRSWGPLIFQDLFKKEP